MSDNPHKQSVIDTIYAHARASAGDRQRGVVKPRAAVACILYRQRDGADVELYLVRRAVSLAFLGGFWTFPGGAVEHDDASWVAAAVREMAEEVAIELAADERCFINAGRWVTPDYAPVRFDTRYVLVDVPSGQQPDWSRSDGELSDGAWVTPREALARRDAGEWMVAAPVAVALERLMDGLSGASERLDQAAQVANNAARWWEILPGVALSPLLSPTLPPATHTNCSWFGSGQMIAVDPASPYPAEQAELERVVRQLSDCGRQLVEIWLTHHHLDHVSGAEALSALTGASIAAHPATAERLCGRVRIDRKLADGEVRQLSGPFPRSVRVMHTPGHAPGHVCVVEQETGVIAAGDMVAGVGTILVDPSEGDMAAYLESLRALRRLQPRALIPAHGGVINAVQEKLDGYVTHRLWREARVVEALAELGLSGPTRLVSRVYADVPASVHPLAERSLLAHLDKLAAEGIAVRHGEQWQLA